MCWLMSTLVVGLCFSWGVGVAAMRAANAARSQALLQAAAAKVQASIQNNSVFQANPSLATTAAVFTGVFLDVRSSVVYGCFLAVFAFLFGLMRAYAPKLAFTSIFATIGQTMSHSALRTVCEQLERVEQAVAIQGEVMTAVQDGPVEGERTGIERLAPGQPLFLKMEGVKTLMTVVMKQLSATSGMLSLEFSVGKWSSDDVRDVIEPLGSVVARSLGLQSFSKLVWRTQELQREADDGPIRKPLHSMGLRRVVDVMPLIESATLELREAITAGAVAMRKNLDNINHRRWTKKADIDSQLRQELDGAYERLTTALKNFTQDGQDATRMQILGPFIALLHSEMTKIEQESLPFRSLFIAFVLGTNLVSLSESILKTMDVVRTTVGKRTKNRLWAPRGLRQIGKLFRVKGVGEDENGVALGENVGGQAIGEDGVEEAGTKDYKLDPDSRPPTNVLQMIMNKLHGLYQWCGTPEAIFGFKYAFVSVAIWIPAVVSTTAEREREIKRLADRNV
ncbi:hypothetical protein D9757_005305 [Collybiopsis confluens]|uniref:Putative ER transporter 6TM N-terminal domain-containing protein n=1 Tax=Collybiopsis confluens TaxID=2823264 RepID=A0A8H5HVU2_9AGAR|nr:hypothetical protein D9757_005305 [Collybiopsis confluens]